VKGALHAIGDYIIRTLLAIDQLLNVVICNGSPDETMSAASYRMNRDGRWWGFMMPVIDLMFWWQGPNHCRNAYLKEIARVQFPDEYRGQ
jgi:hypothetical protein